MPVAVEYDPVSLLQVTVTWDMFVRHKSARDQPHEQNAFGLIIIWNYGEQEHKSNNNSMHRIELNWIRNEFGQDKDSALKGIDLL